MALALLELARAGDLWQAKHHLFGAARLRPDDSGLWYDLSGVEHALGARVDGVARGIRHG